jgi:hypothetical protein
MLMMKPDLVSSWYDIKAQADAYTTLLSIEHGLCETPLLVDVQVRDEHDHVFPGSGNEDTRYGNVLITEIHNLTISFLYKRSLYILQDILFLSGNLCF